MTRRDADSPPPSWIPIVAAFVVPIVVVGSAVFYLHKKDAAATDRSPLNLVVHLNDKGGTPVENREITVSQSGSEPQPVMTDSAGLATTTLYGMTPYVIKIGEKKIQKTVSSSQPKDKPVEVTITLDE